MGKKIKLFFFQLQKIFARPLIWQTTWNALIASYMIFQMEYTVVKWNIAILLAFRFQHFATNCHMCGDWWLTKSSHAHNNILTTKIENETIHYHCVSRKKKYIQTNRVHFPTHNQNRNVPSAKKKIVFILRDKIEFIQHFDQIFWLFNVPAG